MMKRGTIILIFVFHAILFAGVLYYFSKRTNEDGTVISEETWPLVHESDNNTYKRITYMSDGNKVVALLGIPTPLRVKNPVIIYNRGGNREYCKIERPNKLITHLVRAGYVVIASQYRGNDGGQGQEEFGGRDIYDVLNLFKTLENLNYCDMNQVYMVGGSRGGMMTYLALKRDVPVKGAIVIGGLSDLVSQAESDPVWEENVLTQLIPHYHERKKPELIARSAIYWPEKIKVPLLIQHCFDDEKVSYSQAQELADKLSPHRTLLLIYEGGHTVTDEMIEDILWWLALRAI